MPLELWGSPLWLFFTLTLPSSTCRWFCSWTCVLSSHASYDHFPNAYSKEIPGLHSLSTSLLFHALLYETEPSRLHQNLNSSCSARGNAQAWSEFFFLPHSLEQGCQAHFHQGPHQPHGCLQRAEHNFSSLTVKE